MFTKLGGRFINEQAGFSPNPYYTDWNTYTIYHDGEKYAFQNGGSSDSDYWILEGINVVKLTYPEYPTKFDFELYRLHKQYSSQCFPQQCGGGNAKEN